VWPGSAPGNVAATKVWFPPGRWTDWFTGATFTGPSTQTLQVPLNRMPVFVKDGGIVPMQPSSSHAQDAGATPISLRVFAGASGQTEMYDDAGTGLGYEHGQYTDTPVRYLSQRDSSSVVIGAARGHYPGEPASRSYSVDLTDLSSPRAVLADGRPLPASDWSYDNATHTLTATLGNVPVNATATVTQIGGSPVQAPEPAATQLTISPVDSLTAAPGATTTVRTTFANSGPGGVSGVSVGLDAPSGWTVTPTTPTTASSVAAGSSLTASWLVTAPAGAGSGQTEAATLSAKASYTDTATGAAESVTAQQTPTPVITSVSPGTASAGQVVTVSGANFGATQGSGYLTFSDDGTNWGAPPDTATFSLDSWSDDKITFTVPTPSAGGVWHVDPGSTATVTVTTANGTSSPATLAIGSG